MSVDLQQGIPIKARFSLDLDLNERNLILRLRSMKKPQIIMIVTDTAGKPITILGISQILNEQLFPAK